MFALRYCLNRFAFFITLGCAALLSACGSGSTFEPLNPTRVISFGDGLSDLGNSATGGRFTVNDGSQNIWIERVASSYGKTITAQISGGLGYASGGSGVSAIAAQITAFLPGNIGKSDLLIIDAGVSELAALATANPTDNAALNAAAAASGRALAAQVLRLTNAGAKHVVIANAPDLGRTPFASLQTRTVALTAASRIFNDSLKVTLANVTDNVLLIDNEAYVNSLANTPSNLGTGGTASVPACATATFTPVSTSTCTTTTLNISAGVTSATYNLSLYADDRHLAPAAHRLLGDNAYNRIRARW